ncbi:alcohol dehydrogenase catalytic domain-containing protein [Klenkia sp. LSe6-5]|uniref:alcohol dehydrogenase n=1 Tax=Klenkia sesuvii TaxID=3103137 RepID=A0ABU8DUN4_9ACTN
MPRRTAETSSTDEEDVIKAAVVPALGAALQIEDRAVPDPGPGEVLVQIEANGLCHTDIQPRGDRPVQPSPPSVPSHEGVGVVVAVAPPLEHLPWGHIRVLLDQVTDPQAGRTPTQPR